MQSDYVLSSALSGYRELVGALGGDAKPLLAANAIDPALLDDPDAKLELTSVAKLLEASAATLDCPDFGMLLAERQDGVRLSRYLSPIYLTAPTLLEAVQYTVTHAHAHNTGISVAVEWLEEHDCYLQRFDILNDEIAPFPQVIELLSLLTQRASIELSKGYARAHCILFAHRPISSTENYRSKFGTIVKFRQSHSGLLFSDASFNLRIRDEEDAFRSQVARMSKLTPQRSDSAVRRIREAIRANLSSNCTRSDVCAAVDIPIRTANRRLHEAGYSFQSLRDEIRRNLALQYLGLSDLSMTEIAAELGYSEPAALTHSCRRWFGLSPLAQRRQMRSDRAA